MIRMIINIAILVFTLVFFLVGVRMNINNRQLQNTDPSTRASYLYYSIQGEDISSVTIYSDQVLIKFNDIDSQISLPARIDFSITGAFDEKNFTSVGQAKILDGDCETFDILVNPGTYNVVQVECYN